MDVYHFDASALVKYYIREPGSTWIRSVINVVGIQGGTSSSLISLADPSVAEVAAAFAVLYRTQRIRRPTWDGVFAQFMHDVRQKYLLVRTNQEDFFQAARLTQTHPLKAYDAVQLAVALRYAATLASSQILMTFVSGDRALLTAARAEGLVTDNPFDHVSPADTANPA